MTAASQFESQELEPDWEWAVARYAVDLQAAVIEVYAANHETPPSFQQLQTICKIAAETRLREVRGW